MLVGRTCLCLLIFPMDLPSLEQWYLMSLFQKISSEKITPSILRLFTNSMLNDPNFKGQPITRTTGAEHYCFCF